MGKRFSSRELYKLRNSIPIDVLIEKKLTIPSKISEGFFRFLCPLCNEFQTAVNPKTNLGRCFRCEKNFNTIDMVMVWHKTGFVDSVCNEARFKGRGRGMAKGWRSTSMSSYSRIYRGAYAEFSIYFL